MTAVRVACIRLRDAPLAALLRLEPELADSAVAVVSGTNTAGAVLACTARARASGVAPGQTVHQARALLPALRVRTLDDGAIAAARGALADAAAGVAPRVEPDGDRVYLDVGEVRGLYPSEAGVAAALTAAAARVGLAVDVGIAGNKSVARVAASRRVGGAVVPAGEERAFLAPLPLDVLPLSSLVRLACTRLGVRRLGDLAALPADALGTRFGPEGALLAQRARGVDATPLFPRPHATRFEESLDLEWEVFDVEALAFVLKRLCDALLARLACRALAAAGIQLSLGLLSRARDERALTVFAPTRDAGTLVHLLRASLEARPPPDAVVSVRLSAAAAAMRPAQLELFEPPGPVPEALSLTLARLAVVVGEGRVGVPAVPDTHRPHAVSVAPFVLRERAEVTVTPVGEAPEPFAALHVFRPPRAAEVMLSPAGAMEHVRAGDIAGRVRVYCGPFRVAGDWWGERFDHDGYDVELTDGGLYLVAFDRVANAWRIDGTYD